ncbi:MAG TPA: alkaline phosphatase family protein [Chloroflexota bacterium]
MAPGSATRHSERGSVVEVNGRQYRVPTRPTVVITVDGGDPRYFDDALRRGLMPCLGGLLVDAGTYARGLCQMPSLTNPNNLAIVTGAPAKVHGITGNHILGPDAREVQLTDPAFLRAPTIHSAMRAAGVRVLAVSAKDKLRRLLGAGGVPSVSAERAAEYALPDYGVEDMAALVGRPPPGIYEWQLSMYAMEMGLAIHRRVGLELVYVSLTDFVQHTRAPGEPLSDEFLAGFDLLLGEYLAEGFVVAVTADHGMNTKTHIVYLEEVLAGAGVRDAHVVLPITDPYVAHHGALGSFAWIHLPAAEIERAREAVAGLVGIEEVYTREEAAVVYQHPTDRIGDLSVAADASTALGSSEHKHDLSQLGATLRSHGGRHEQIVPIIVSEPLVAAYASLLNAGLRNSDVHDLVLNGIVAGA